MLYDKLLAFLFPSIALCYTHKTLEFSVDYFKDRKIPFICQITCENDVVWDVKFIKAASNNSVAVSVSTRGSWNENMKQCFRKHFSSIGVLINAQCENSEQVFYAASQNMWFDSGHVWLIVDEAGEVNNHKNRSHDAVSLEDSKSSSKTLELLKEMNISVDADIVIAMQNGKQFILHDVFNFGKVQGGSLIVKEAGTWSHESGLVSDLNGYKYYRRWDFGQCSMRVMSVATIPSKDFDPKMLTDVRPVKGISTIIRTSTMALVVIAETHNIKFVHTIGDQWIGKLDRNSSNVVLSALFYRQQDLTSVLRLYAPLVSSITYVHTPITSLETRYYYRIPTTGPGKYENQFLRPLSTGTWWCIAGVSVLCTIILLFAARLEARPSSVQYALFSVVASFCQQFFEDNILETRRISGARKLTEFITGMACVLIYNYYTSSVVSWLLNGPPPSIRSLQELLDSPLELIFEDVGYTRSWLNTPGYYYNKKNAKVEDKIRRKVLSKKSTTKLFKPLEEGIAKVKAGGYAYHTETYAANILISQSFDQTELCELGSLKSMEKTLLYPALQKDSPYKEFLSWSLIRLQERGILSCVQRRTIPHSVSCKDSSPRALALGGAAPAFILLAFGFLLGTIIMLLERFTYQMQRKKSNLRIL